ncbi:MAG: hypothetical protein H8E79_04470 [Desulfobulbaceae bacterium]|uniref:Transmembrane protein (PGPGW) n=1 Tax=Candidatus Desulfatifera sulfidica TaxID=2841691 RepID=A0A8J6N9R9_9BACT|nr:hypothetical protein [Candidatus Desulfatifera sulfidica]
MINGLIEITAGQLFAWLGLLSLATFVVSLLIIPWVVTRAKTNYFLVHTYHVDQRHQQHPLLYFIVRIFRNTLGGLLLVAGLCMLFLPGQGIITMIIGLSLLDVPGRQLVLDRLIQIEIIQHSLNWIRHKSGKEPFRFPTKSETEHT